MISRLLFLASLLAVLLIASGCRSPKEEIQPHYEEISQSYRSYFEQSNEPVTLSWDEAEEILLESNLDLRENSNGILLARERTQRVFLDLLPSLRVTTSLANRITDIGSLDEEDFELSVFSFISIPGMVQLRLDHYAALLQEVRAAWIWELEKRQRLVRLRTLFIRQKNLDRRGRTLRLTSLAAGRQTIETNFRGDRPAELERTSRLWALNRAYDRLQFEIRSLLGDFSAEWTLDTTTLPELYTGGSLPKPEDREHFAVLWRQLRAIEMEGAKLRERGAELDYWPDLSMTISSPPLYRRINGETIDFDEDQVIAKLRGNLQVDTTLRNTYRLRQIRRNNAMLIARIKEDTAGLIQQLKDGQTAYQINSEEATIVQAQYDLLLKNLSRGSLDNADDKLESLLRLEEQLAQIESEQSEIETFFWLLDESKWHRKDFEELLASAKEREQRHAFD